MIALVATFSVLVFNKTSEAHYNPGLHNIRHAINKHWCGNTNKYCESGRQAWEVAGCETGQTYNIWARNGQYQGLFQMGNFARERYGHGWNPWIQAKAAHRYYVDANGWEPWACGWAAS